MEKITMRSTFFSLHRGSRSRSTQRPRTRRLVIEELDRRDLPRLLVAFEQVAQTIAYAHSRGIIHRDLKPANIMVGAFGEVQVMDWGLAKVVGTWEEETREESTLFVSRATGEDQASASGTVMGTPAYMSPQQALGQVHALDARTDVFGLGAILCVMLTGKPHRTTLREHGLDVEAADADEMGRTVADSPIRDTLLAALDDWAVLEKDAGRRDRMLAVARQADPGPWQDRFRSVKVRGDRAALERLAGEADLDRLPAATVVALGHLLDEAGPTPSRCCGGPRHGTRRTSGCATAWGRRC
jgi:serine/threonine protein kinase